MPIDQSIPKYFYWGWHFFVLFTLSFKLFVYFKHLGLLIHFFLFEALIPVWEPLF